MGILEAVMASASNAIPSVNRPSRSGVTEEDKRAKEHRDAYRGLIENALKENNPNQIAALLRSAPEGVDTSMYANIAGMQTPEDARKAQMVNASLDWLSGIISPTQPAPAKPPAVQPNAPYITESTMAQPEAKQSNTIPVPKDPGMIRWDNVRYRTALKSLTGQDPGEHAAHTPNWFKQYDEYIDAGMLPGDALRETTAIFGFVPDGASTLGLSPEETDVHATAEIMRLMNSSDVIDFVDSTAPEGANKKALQMGVALSLQAQAGRPIPERYQAVLDRFIGLSSKEFLNDEMRTNIYRLTGKSNSYDIDQGDIAYVNEQIKKENLIMLVQETIAKTRAQTETEFELEPDKPIPGKERAEQGIPPEVKTYTQLTEEGKRFSEPWERKLYNELYAIKRDFDEMNVALFGTKDNPEWGIFHDVGDSMPARAAAIGAILKDSYLGNERGQAYQYYTDKLATYARKLLVIAGESGGRFTEADVRQILKGAASAGGLLSLPDSRSVAERKHNAFIESLEYRMRDMADKTTIGYQRDDEGGDDKKNQIYDPATQTWIDEE